MPLAVLGLALLATAASAQDTPRPVPTTGERVVLVVGAVGGGALTLFAGPGALLGAGAATFGTSAALGLSPTLGGALLDTAVGTVVAVGTYHVSVLLMTAGGAPHDISVDFGSALIGLAIGSATMGLAHGVRLAALRSDGPANAIPTLLSTSTGDIVPGLAFSVGL